MGRRQNNIIAGLDIGTSKITALIAESDGQGSLQILGEGTIPSEGLKNGMVVDLDVTTRAIERAISQAESSANTQVDKVVIGIAGKHIQCQNNRAEINAANPLRGITEEDVNNVISKAKDVVVPQGRELLHVVIQEYFLDDNGGIKNPIGMAGTRLAVDVHIVTGAVAAAQNIGKCVNAAGWKVENVVLQPLASATSVLTEDEKNIGVIMADIGGGTIDMVAYARGGIRYTQVIPMGGDYITSDLAYGLRVARNDAENLKKHYGCALISLLTDRTEQIEIRGVVAGSADMIPRQRLVEIIGPRVTEMLTLIKEETGQIQNKYRNQAGIVLTGGVALLPGVKEIIERIFNLPARVGYPTGYAGFSDVLNSPVYSTALGLLQFGLARREDSTVGEKGALGKMYDKIIGFSEKYL